MARCGQHPAGSGGLGSAGWISRRAGLSTTPLRLGWRQREAAASGGRRRTVLAHIQEPPDAALDGGQVLERVLDVPEGLGPAAGLQGRRGGAVRALGVRGRGARPVPRPSHPLTLALTASRGSAMPRRCPSWVEVGSWAATRRLLEESDMPTPCGGLPGRSGGRRGAGTAEFEWRCVRWGREAGPGAIDRTGAQDSDCWPCRNQATGHPTPCAWDLSVLPLNRAAIGAFQPHPDTTCKLSRPTPGPCASSCPLPAHSAAAV